jgi:putative FmdB family regulatory protein
LLYGVFYAIVVQGLPAGQKKEVAIMPSYEYVCIDCKIVFMIFLSIKEQEAMSKITCPHCGSDNVKKQFAPFFAKTSSKS